MKRMMLVATAALALAGCQGDPHNLDAAERSTAELGALKYGQAAGLGFVSVSGLDSDGDGYVTTTFKDPGGRLISAVCSYRDGAAGCKTK